MTLDRLSLTNFRNYADVILEPGPGLVILTGENGAGKTNILEAVSLMAPGRGMRGAALSDMSRSDGPGGMGVAGRIGDLDIGTGTVASAPDRRIVRINGASAPANALSEWLSIIWLTPAMDRLFTDGAGERRRFLDRLTLALYPAHAHHSARYEAAMRQRNRLLAQDDAPDPDWLTALEAQMAEHGAAISERRAGLVFALNERIHHSPDGPFARATIALEGWQHQGQLADELRQSRQRDAAAGRALFGPQRSDLAVMHVAKKQPAARCSTGEQKALLLNIILAHADLVAEQTQRRPILLLDEIAAHLDPARRVALFQRLADGGGQVWMTGTERSLFGELHESASQFTVSNGQVFPS